MADATRTIRFRFWLWLIRVIGVIVPRRLRAAWRQEQFECGMRNAECGIESNTGIRRLG